MKYVKSDLLIQEEPPKKLTPTAGKASEVEKENSAQNHSDLEGETWENKRQKMIEEVMEIGTDLCELPNLD
jgi:hypothetical protein